MYFKNKVVVFKIGDKKKLVDLVYKNVLEDLMYYYKLYWVKEEKLGE